MLWAPPPRGRESSRRLERTHEGLHGLGVELGARDPVGGEIGDLMGVDYAPPDERHQTGVADSQVLASLKTGQDVRVRRLRSLVDVVMRSERLHAIVGPAQAARRGERPHVEDARDLPVVESAGQLFDELGHRSARLRPYRRSSPTRGATPGKAARMSARRSRHEHI